MALAQVPVVVEREAMDDERPPHDPPTAAEDADDDMFEPGTEANHEALELLRELLVDVGFRVHKKPRREATLRVYLPDRDHPLLNPRFEVSGDAFGAPQHDESIVFTAWTSGAGGDLERRIAQLPPSDGFTFVRGDGHSSPGLALVGWFVVPLVFEEGDEERFDHAALEGSLRQLRELLEKVA